MPRLPREAMRETVELSDTENDILWPQADLDYMQDSSDNGDGDPDVQITDASDWKRIHDPPVTAPRLRSLPPGDEVVKQHDVFGDLDLSSGISVALSNGDYFRIKHVVKRVDGTLRMHGWRLRRNSRVKGWLNQTVGEVCLVVTARFDDDRSDLERGLEELSFRTIDFGAKDWIRKIVFTNQEYPAFSDLQRYPKDEEGREKYWSEGILVCRRKHVLLWTPESATKPAKNFDEQSLQWLRREEVDEGCAIWDEFKVSQWTGGRIAKGRMGKRGIVDAADAIQQYNERVLQRNMHRHGLLRDTGSSTGSKYTAADICCGGGGASGGIAETPFKLRFGLDMDDAAARTWKCNWPDATTYCMPISDFVFAHHINDCEYVHAIHISFSCKAWAWCNSKKGLNVDMIDMNPADVATTMASTSILPTLRPRLVTFENTDGFSRMNIHQLYFNLFLSSVASSGNHGNHGYNIRWKVVDLARYGAYSHRKRLIIIASCPGETLPEFPPPTHGDEPGLLPFRTVREAIAGISPRDPLHNVVDMYNKRLRNMDPAPWDAPLRKGFTTGGPGEIHPDGEREFTDRECMNLMGFRPTHQFPPGLTRTKKMEIIGNAVPRQLIKLIFRKFYNVLCETDAKITKCMNVDLEEEDSDTMTPPSRLSSSMASSSTLRSTPDEEYARRKKLRAQNAIELDGPDPAIVPARSAKTARASDRNFFTSATEPLRRITSVEDGMNPFRRSSLQDTKALKTALDPSAAPSQPSARKRRHDDTPDTQQGARRLSTSAYGQEQSTVPQQPSKKQRRTLDSSFAVQKKVARDPAAAQPKFSGRRDIIDLTGED